MKYTIRFSCPTDLFFSPWAMVVIRETGGPLRVQAPHPYAGDILFGFEHEPQECELICFTTPDWPTQAAGMHPVFAGLGGMYSLRGYVVEDIYIHAEEDRV